MIPKDVKPGDLVLAAWNAALISMRSLVILPGRGILLTKHPGGTIINARSAVNGFSGAWSVSASDGFVTVSQGFVNAAEPMVGKLALSDAQTKIPFKPTGFKDGRRWVGIKVTVDAATGKMKEKDITEKDLTVVVQDSPTAKDTTGLVGFHPVAVILEKPVVSTRQIAFFDYQHSTAKAKNGFRHFFHIA